MQSEWDPYLHNVVYPVIVGVSDVNSYRFKSHPVSLTIVSDDDWSNGHRVTRTGGSTITCTHKKNK